MNDGERQAFIHAARLCRQYRAENKKLKTALVLEAAIIAGFVVWTIAK